MIGHIRKNGIYYLYVAPLLVLTLVFGIWPIVKSIQLSFLDSQTALSDHPLFVGLHNYLDVFHDSYFYGSLGVTILYTVVVVPLNLAVAVGMALVAKNLKYGRQFFLFAMFTPVVIPDIVSAIIWQWMYSKDLGAINSFLHLFGIAPIGWLSDPHLALWAIMIADTWKHAGFFAVIFYTNLRIIDPSFYEVSKLEGANRWQTFRFITLPELRPATTLNLVYALIEFLKTFTVAFVMTSGGPNFRTNFLTYYAYTQFSKLNYGDATSMATLLFLAILIVTLSSLAVRKRREAT